MVCVGALDLDLVVLIRVGCARQLSILLLCRAHFVAISRPHASHDACITAPKICICCPGVIRHGLQIYLFAPLYNALIMQMTACPVQVTVGSGPRRRLHQPREGDAAAGWRSGRWPWAVEAQGGDCSHRSSCKPHAHVELADFNVFTLGSQKAGPHGTAG